VTILGGGWGVKRIWKEGYVVNRHGVGRRHMAKKFKAIKGRVPNSGEILGL
jgi:hypothetical protein